VDTLNGVIAITSVAGYRALDLKLTATKDADAAKDSPYNGKVLMQIACNQSYGELSVPAVVEEEGSCVTNSYLIGQLPAPRDARSQWEFFMQNNRLCAINGPQFKYDFEVGEDAMHRYDPVYTPTTINISSIVDQCALLAGVLRGFVSRKSTDASGINGAVKISGAGNSVTFQATDGISNAVIGTLPVPVEIAEPFDLLLPVAQFESWKNLPKNVPVFMAVDAQHQLTLNVNNGAIKIQHNTLSNLLDNVEDVADFAAKFNAVETPEDFEELKMSMKYSPEDLEYMVGSATIYADSDPTIILTTDSVKKTANIMVRTSVADAQVDLNDINIIKHGNMSVNRSSLSLLNKLKLLRTKAPAPIPGPPPTADSAEKAAAPEKASPQDQWMVMRIFEGVVMIGTPDASWIGITSEMSI
jgi:hypothetical protein